MEINELILNNLSYIEKSIAYRWEYINGNKIEYEDFYQQVMLELITNYNREKNKNSSFEGYVNVIILRVMKRYVFENNSLIKIPDYCRRMVYIVEELNNQHFMNHGEYLSVQELTKIVNERNYFGYDMNENQMLKILKLIKYIDDNIYYNYDDDIDDELVISDTISSNDDVEEEVLGKVMCEEFTECIKELNPRLSKVYIEYYGLEGNALSSRELQKKYKISRQAINSKIRRMHKKIKNNKEKIKKFIY